MNGGSREMTLKEWVGRLPEGHRACLEFEELQKFRFAQVELDDCWALLLSDGSVPSDMDYVPDYIRRLQEERETAWATDDLVSDRIVKVLNRAIRVDPRALGALCEIRVPCNNALAQDPTIQVSYSLGFGVIGLLSGVAGAHEDGFSKVVAIYETVCLEHGIVDKQVGRQCPVDGCRQVVELGRLVRFERTRQPEGPE